MSSGLQHRIVWFSWKHKKQVFTQLEERQMSANVLPYPKRSAVLAKRGDVVNVSLCMTRVHITGEGRSIVLISQGI